MRKQNILVLLMAAVQFTHIVDFVIIMPLGPQLMRIFNLNSSQFGLVVSGYTFSAAIFSIIGAFFLDKINRKTALLVMYIGFIFGTFLCALSHNYYILVFSRIFTGAFGGLIGSLVLSIIGDIIPENKRGKAIGIVMGSFSLASVVGIPSGLLIANQFGWNAPFFAVGGLGLIIIVYLFIYMENMVAHLEDKLTIEKWHTFFTNIIKSKNQQLALFLTFTMVFGHFLLIPFLSPFMVANVGFEENDLSYIYLLGGFVSFFTSPIIGRFSDKYGKKNVYIIFAILFIPLIIVITHMSNIAIYFALIFSTLFFILVGGRTVPATASVTSTVELKQRGSFMAFNSSVQQFSAGLASFIAGIIVYKNSLGYFVNYDIVGYLAISFNIFSIFVMLKLKVKKN